MDKCLDMVFFGASDMDSDKDPDKLKSLTLDSDWGPTQPGVYDKLHRIYRDFDEIGHVIRQEYEDGPNKVAIILMTKTKYALNPGQKRTKIGNS